MWAYFYPPSNEAMPDIEDDDSIPRLPILHISPDEGSDRCIAISQNLSSVLNDPFAADVAEETLDLVTIPDSLRGIAVSDTEMQDIIVSLTKLPKRRRIMNNNKDIIIDRTSELSYCMKTVPEVFFRRDFNIQLILQKILSSSDETIYSSTQMACYVDIVEQTLFSQISTKRYSFLNSLRTVSNLQTEMDEGLDSIYTLKKHIKLLYNTFVQSKLHLIRLEIRRKNQLRLYNTLELLDTVKNTPNTVKLLLSTHDYVTTLQVIESAREIVTNECKGIRCLNFFDIRLDELLELTNKFILQDFIDTAMNINDNDDEDDDDDDILFLLPSIYKLNKLPEIAIAYREALNLSLKQTLGDMIYESLNKYSNNKISNNINTQELHEKISELTHDHFQLVLKDVFMYVTRTIKRLQYIIKIIVKAINHVGDDDEVLFGKELMKEISRKTGLFFWKKDITSIYNNIIIQYIDICNSKCSNILNMRHKEHASLTPSEFSSYHKLVMIFINYTEMISKTKLMRLRSILIKQGKSMLVLFHALQLQIVAQALETEKWKRVLVPKDYQKLINHKLLLNKDINLSYETTIDDQIPSSSQKKLYIDITLEDKKTTTTTTTKRIYFPITQGILVLIRSLSSYIQLVNELPMLVNDVINRLIELLKLFNSRTCQLVLGAGAIQTAELTSITATHLALASQCLELVVTQIDVIKSWLMKLIPQKHVILLDSFNRIKCDYRDHQNEILLKIISIVGQRIDITVEVFRKLSWMEEDDNNKDNDDNEDNDDNNIVVDKCIRTLMRQIVSLHNTMTDLLSEEHLYFIFSQVSEMLVNGIRLFFGTDLNKLKNNKKKKDRIILNASHIMMKIRNLTAFRQEENSNLLKELYIYIEM